LYVWPRARGWPSKPFERFDEESGDEVGLSDGLGVPCLRIARTRDVHRVVGQDPALHQFLKVLAVENLSTT
jgi:hypothetical protein